VKFGMRCIFLVVSVAWICDACAPSASSGVQTCLSTMMTSMGGNPCAAFDEYTTCVTEAVSSCSSTQKNAFTSQVTQMKTQLASQLGDCSSSSSSSDETSSGEHTHSNSESSSCSSQDVLVKGNACLGSFSGAAGSGNVCGAWQSYECCLKDAFSTCDASVQQNIESTIVSTKAQFKGQLSALANCAAATCSSGGQSTPVEVETLLLVAVEIDPQAFEVDKYIAAVQKAIGVSDVSAVLKAFEIVVKYLMPSGAETAAVRAAVAKANSVAESAVVVKMSGARRLGSGRRLGTNADVTITVSDAATAVVVKTSAASVTGLTSDLGGAVSLSQPPVASAVVETKVKTESSATGNLATQIQSAGADIGGKVTAEVKTVPDVPTGANGAPSSMDVILAIALILLQAAM